MLRCVEVADLDAVDEQHPVALPVEAVGEDAPCRRCPSGTPGSSTVPRTRSPMLQVELVAVRLGQGVRLPDRHGAPVCPHAAVADRISIRSLGSPPCEKHARKPRGSAREAPRQAVPHRRRVRVRSRHRSGVPQDRQRGPAARVPCRQGAAQGARGSHRRRAGTRAGAARRGPELPRARPCASTTSTSSPPRRSRSPAGSDDGPVAFDATCEVRPEITVPGYGGLRVELPSPIADRGRDRRGRRRPSCAGTARSVDVDRPVAVRRPRHARPRRHPRRRARAGPQHRGLAVRGRQGLGRPRLRRRAARRLGRRRADVHARRRTAPRSRPTSRSRRQACRRRCCPS